MLAVTKHTVDDFVCYPVSCVACAVFLAPQTSTQYTDRDYENNVLFCNITFFAAFSIDAEERTY